MHSRHARNLYDPKIKSFFEIEWTLFEINRIFRLRSKQCDLTPHYLINNRRIFNVVTDDLAEKPYIPQKNYFYEFVANVLRDNIDILIFDLH